MNTIYKMTNLIYLIYKKNLRNVSSVLLSFLQTVCHSCEGRRLIISFIIFTSIFSSSIFSQENVSFSGTIYSAYSKKPIDLASVILIEARKSVTTNRLGYYEIKNIKPGSYTLIIKAMGMKKLQRKIEINSSLRKTFYLQTATIKGSAITITGERDIQKLSRHTMTVEQLKEVPATFGDSIGALTTLPAVIRSSRMGIFGTLIIRGAPQTANMYFIDDVPIINPQHFGGIHSVINNDLMSEIDLYSSAFPSQFGAALGAIININTIDKADKFGGVAEIGLISSNLLVKGPIQVSGKTGLGELTSKTAGLISSDTAGKKETKGYWIAAGRIGYFSVFIPMLYDLFTDNDELSLPQYFDYQAKGKYYFSKDHSMTVLLFGATDTFAAIDDDEESFEERVQRGSDPLTNGFEFKMKVFANSQSIYYTYQPSDKLTNKTMFYSSLNDNYFYIDSKNSIFKDIHISSKPNSFALKNKTIFEWWKDKAELRAGLETIYYSFTSSGKTIVPKKTVRMPIDFGDESLFEEYNFNDEFSNKSLGGYIENKFTYAGLTFTPGIRADYLERSDQQTIDPRGLISWELSTKTTFMAAAGLYSSFIQINPVWFNNQPEIASSKTADPEQAYHRSVGVEQKLDLFKIKVEGFYNNFFNLMEPDANSGTDSVEDLGSSTGKRRNVGFEVMLTKDQDRKKIKEFYGWVSYTYLKSEHRTGISLSSDKYAHTYLPSEQDQRHSFKLVAGLIFGKHKFGARFEYATSFPYTPTIGSNGPDRIYGRYTDVGGKPLSARYPADHRLDIRYSNKTNYEWGSLTWYVEVINVYNQVPTVSDWVYNQPYKKGTNPVVQQVEGAIIMIPNFGVEVRF